MYLKSKKESPRRERNGLVSHILMQKGDLPNDRLSVTWVDLAPGSAQKAHRHVPEQVYVIVKGKGLMQIGDEEQNVEAGDLLHIPSNAVHRITNRSGEDILSYISASTPAFDLKGLYDAGDLQQKNHGENDA